MFAEKSSEKSSENIKAPSQVFRWFEKMKSNYEHTINAVLTRFEQHTDKQQEKLQFAHMEHIESLKAAHQQQHNQNQATIAQLQADISYYQQQIAQQNNALEQLNARYDAVMTTFLQQKKRDIDLEAIFSEEELVEQENQDSSVTLTLPENSKVNEQQFHTKQYPYDQIDDNAIEINEELAEKLYIEAMHCREEKQLNDAISLFKQAAKLGCAKSRGALGRAYFLAEGVDENPTLGLAWLMTAAEQGLPQAIKRVSHFKECDPELFLEAEQLKVSI